MNDGYYAGIMDVQIIPHWKIPSCIQPFLGRKKFPPAPLDYGGIDGRQVGGMVCGAAALENWEWAGGMA